MSRAESVEEEKAVFAVPQDTLHIAMDAEMFKDFYTLMSSLLAEEIQLRVEDDGVYLRQMEEVHIALTDMFIPKSYFKQLVKGEKVDELRFIVSDFDAVLTRLTHGDVIDITIAGGKIHVEIKGRRIRIFDVPILEPEKSERRVPTIPFEVRVKTSLEGLLIAIEDAQKLMKSSSTTKGKKRAESVWSAQVSLTTTPMGLLIKAMEEDELRSAQTVLSSGWDIMQFDGGVGKQVNVAISYLIDIVKAVSKVTNMIQIEFSTDMPLHIIAEMPFKGVKLEYWIAPRIRIEGEKEVEAK